MTTKRTKADLEREIAALRAQVETLTTVNAKLVDALTHAATHPYVPPVVLPPAVGPAIVPYVPPTTVPFWKIGEVWCGNNVAACPPSYPTTIVSVADHLAATGANPTCTLS